MRSLDGPWLLYDNRQDPYQLDNLVARADAQDLVAEFDELLQERLDARGDEFLPGLEYCQRWGYPLDERETVPYT